MGFLDKLKNAANMASEQLAKANEEKKKAELEKYAKDVPVQNLPIIGFVRGFAGLENLQGAQLCLDGENDRVYIRIKAEKGPYKYSNVGGYDIDSFIELRYTNSEVRKMSSMTMYIDYFELVHSNSHDIQFSVTTTSYDANSNEIPQLGNFDKKARLNLIYPFIDVITDEATKSWVNEFSQRNELLPLFDENGEVFIDNMKKNADMLCSE
ncbi:MAG: hypothetical protein IJ944_02370 [Clostridia bacterium]|nr:hypothetical protein [Clostridia bacterium]